MESGDFPNPENIPSDDKLELSEEVRAALRLEIVAALAEYRAVETVNDLLQKSWLMQMIVDRAMNSIERTGISLEGFETAVSEVIARTLSELLPEAPEEEPDSSSGTREPRKPILPSLLGSIAMALPNDSPEMA